MSMTPPRPVSEKERNSWEWRTKLHKQEIERYRERIRKGEKTLYEKIFSSVAFFAFAFLLINGIRMLIEWIK